MSRTWFSVAPRPLPSAAKPRPSPRRLCARLRFRHTPAISISLKESTLKQRGLHCCPRPALGSSLCSDNAVRAQQTTRLGCYGDGGAAALLMRGPPLRASGRPEASVERGAEQCQWIVTCRRWRVWALFPCPISGSKSL